jgi:hypothetical protein
VRKILPLFCIFLAISCSREPLDGTVYVIRGDGDVTRAAAVGIYVLPFKTHTAFIDAYSAEKKIQDDIYLETYLNDTCRTFPPLKKNLLNQYEKSLYEFSSECQEEKNSLIGIEIPQTIKNKILREKERLTKLVAQEQLRIEESIRSKIKISFDYSDLKWGTVTIKNNSPYIVSSDGRGTGGFVMGELATNCRDDRVDIYPGRSQTMHLGCYYSPIVHELVEKGARVVFEAFDIPALYMENFGPVTEDKTLGSWTFFKSLKQPQDDGTEDSMTISGLLEQVERRGQRVNFNNLAVQEVGSGQLQNLKSDLEKSQSLHANSESCDLLILRKRETENLVCPSIGSGRSTIQRFLENAIDLGIPDILPPDIRKNEPMVSFVQRNAIAKTTTDIDGKFNLNKLPNEPFLIYSSYQDKFINVEWLVPIENNENVIELNNANSVFQNDN